jgi:hypothetical protein
VAAEEAWAYWTGAEASALDWMEAADSFPCLLLLSQFLLCYWRRGPVPWDGGEKIGKEDFLKLVE